VLSGEGDDQLAGGDEGLIVGQGDVHAPADAEEGGAEAGGADHGGDEEVGLGGFDEALGGVRAEQQPTVGGFGEVVAERRGLALLSESEAGPRMVGGLSGEFFRAAAGGEADHLDTAAEIADDVKRALADAAGRAEQGDPAPGTPLG